MVHGLLPKRIQEDLEPPMTNYYVHLGFDWSSYLVGSVWGSSPGTNRWLEYAVTTSATGPEWGASLCQFQPNDTLSFRIWCLSILSKYTVSGYVGMNALALDPGTGIVPKYTSDSGLVSLSGSSSLVWSQGGESLDLTANMAAGPDPSPWGRSAGYNTNAIGPLTFLNPNKDSLEPFYFKMNFKLSVTANTTTREFISDPETRIGSGVKN